MAKGIVSLFTKVLLVCSPMELSMAKHIVSLFTHRAIHG